MVAAATTTNLVLGAPSPIDAANHLLAAWRKSDRASARTEADEAAVSALFAQSYPASGPQARGCDENPTASNCFFRIGDGGLNLHAIHTPVGWRVDTAQFVQ